MINNRKFKKNKTNANSGKGNSIKDSFYSLKNKKLLQPSSEAERLLMLIMEFDSMSESYRQFEFRMVSIRSFNQIASSPAIIAAKDNRRHYIVLSNELSNNEAFAQATCEQFQKSEPYPITLTVIKPADIINNLSAKNLSFLYQYALLPACRADFLQIKKYLEFNEEASIKRLKFLVKNEAAIYQLIFHGALDADLNAALISDETLVNANPLINSIIRGL